MRMFKLVLKTNYRLMHVKSIGECSKVGGGGHSAILLTFNKLQVFIKIFVLSIFERPFYTGFTVIQSSADKAFNCKPYIYIYNADLHKRHLYN